MKKKVLALTLALALTTQVPALAVEDYTIGSDTSIVVIEPKTIEVQLSYQVEGRWYDMGFADITLTFDGTSSPLTTEQKEEIRDQVPSGVNWTTLKYVSEDEGRPDKRPWHLDGELEDYPVTFFLRIDRTFVGGAQPEAQYYPFHSTEWDMMTWGSVSGFVEPEPNGYDVIMEADNIEDVKERFKAVEEVLLDKPDLQDKNCNLRQVIMKNYGVSEEDLDAGKVDVIWYVSKHETQCPHCLYHVDGVVYYTENGAPVNKEGYLEITHEYYVAGGREPETIVEEPKITVVDKQEVNLMDYLRAGDDYAYQYALEGEETINEVLTVEPGTTRAIRLIYSREPEVESTPSPEVTPSIAPTPEPTSTPEPAPTPSEKAPETTPSPSVEPVATPTPIPEATTVPTPPPPPAVTQSPIVEEDEPSSEEEDEDDPEPKLTPSPEPEPTIEEFLDPDVPLAGLPDAWLPEPSPTEDETLIEDEDVPMAQVPQTGDDIGLWLSLFALAFAGITAKKKRSFDI